jgi:ABC-type branched-subunit amino acid transport system substrate-binding protein
MRLNILIFLFLLLGIQNTSHSQNPINLWKEASLLAKNGNWIETKAKIRPHIFPAPEDSLAPWLIHLYGLACFKTGDLSSAQLAVERIKENFGIWSQLEEVHFLSAQIHFSNRKFTLAWQEMERAKEIPLARVNACLAEFFPSLPPDTLNYFIDNEAFKSSFCTQIFSNLRLENVKISKPKRAPKIGWVLPLDVNNPKKSESAALEFYRGALLASEVLAAQDSAIENHVFDFGNDPGRIEKMIREKAFLGLDLLVGPIKTNAVRPLENYAKKEKILLINPLSAPAKISDSSFAFYTQASAEGLANAAFEFIAPFSPGRKVGIVYGTEKNDSLKAMAYQDLMKKMGQEVVLLKKVGKNSAANLTKFLVESGLDSIGHLFVPNSEPMVKAQLLGAYGWTKAKYTILVVGNWLESQTADFDEFERQPIFFLNQDFVFPQSWNAWKEWQSNYVAKYGGPPSWIAWKGFDLALSFGKIWYEKGQLNAEDLQSGEEIRSALFGKYWFSKGKKGNQHIPVYQITANGIEKIWPR